MLIETILDTFPGKDSHHRLVVVVEQLGGATSRVVIRQETHAANVGWFVQSRVPIEASQLQGLRVALSSGAAIDRQAAEQSPTPTVLSFADAVARQAG